MAKKYDPNIGPDGWDKEAIYDAEIAPLMERIIDICKREEMPFIASFCYRHSDDTGDGDTACCTSYAPGPKSVPNERFRDALNIIRRQDFAAFTITTKPRP